jgi:hypothetical protein
MSICVTVAGRAGTTATSIARTGIAADFFAGQQEVTLQRLKLRRGVARAIAP